VDVVRTDPDHEQRAFSESLQRLKRHGCSLLLVGSVPRRTRTAAIQRLLGDDALRRRRVVAVTGKRGDRIGTHLERTDGRLLDHASGAVVRDTAVAAPAPTPSLRVRRVEAGLDALEEAIGAEIDHVAAGGPLAPGELRLSVDGLVPLVERHDVVSVGQFVESVGDRVRTVDGMAHYVVPAPYDSETVQSLRGHVDATVELRERRDGPEQRWYLSEPELTTPWVDV
jgi:hypothetical protein